MAVGGFQVGPFQPAFQQEAGVTVPDVVGELEADGTTTLEGAGFVVSVQTEYSSTVEAGRVIRQEPIGGSLASSGSTVIIWVSLGASIGAGRKTNRRRYFVEIDGQQFLVDNAQQAQALLDQARAMAERSSEIAARKVEKRVKKVVAKGKDPGPIRIERPKVTASPELQLDLSAIRADIDRLYANAAALVEMRLLLEMKAAEEDEEDALLLLLM